MLQKAQDVKSLFGADLFFSPARQSVLVLDSQPEA
jgi:hypothetical protein